MNSVVFDKIFAEMLQMFEYSFISASANSSDPKLEF